MKTLTINLVKHSFQIHFNQQNARLSNNFQRSFSINSFINKDNEEKKENIIIKKLTELNEWYMQLTGLDEVKKLQDRVIITQTRLEKAQEERREVGKILSETRKQATELQEQLHNIKRLDNVARYLELTKQETEMIRLEKELATKFDMLDKAEREIFTSLSNAVRDSHEKEKSQSEYTKYWGIILSIFGTILGAVVSTMISTIRNHQIVDGINKGVEDKFNQMVGIISNDGKNLNFLERVINENNKTSKMILQKIIASEQQLQELIQKSSPKNVLFPNQLTSKDKAINVDKFVLTQLHLLQDHQKEIKNLILQSKSVQNNEGINWYFVGGVTLAVMLLARMLS